MPNINDKESRDSEQGNISKIGDEIYSQDEYDDEDDASDKENSDPLKIRSERNIYSSDYEDPEDEVLKELLIGEKNLEEEELKEELEADDLYNNNNDRFVVGEYDDIRERMAYEHMGLDPDEYEKDMIDDEIEDVADENFFKAKRAAEKRMKYRDKLLKQKNN